jgi:peptide deformylase
MLNIEIYGSQILREKARRVERVDDEIRALSAEMLETMYAENGIGLAAEQIGRSEALCVIDVPVDLDLDADNRRMNPGVNMPLVLVNPEITASSPDESVCEEGCLSFPGISLPIKRANTVSLRYMDLDGEANEVELTGLLARAVQHELDHLNGVLFIDRAPKLKKVSVAGKLKRLQQQSGDRRAVS